jgi:hypothetical protein
MNTMDSLDVLQKYLPLLIPVIILEVGLMIFCVVDIIRRPKTRGSKWMWIPIVVLVNLFGPIAYLLFGREE